MPAPPSSSAPVGSVVTKESAWRLRAYELGISKGAERAKQEAFKTAAEFFEARAVGQFGVYVWEIGKAKPNTP